MNSMDILWLTWLVLPVGAAMILLSSKSRRTVMAGALICLAAIFYIVRFWEAFVWQFDLIRGWRIEIPVRAGDYQVVFTQRPSLDFYDTRLRVLRADGREASLVIDGDAGKWVNPRLLREGAQCWIIADNLDRDRAPMIDVTGGVVSVHGWIEGVFRLADLDYVEQTPSPEQGEP